ncbi:uncharacterized protein LOC143061933 [Mytilus galloprovincialis]|uniref:uncharacterized protein LOC143061933 n=1 Tax=Mytilus galloprovincialis TaxID=29158 RepID=UPI003F7C4F73
MPKSCCAVGCKNHNLMLKRLSLFRFPRNAERQIKWLTALKRDKPDGTPWVPTKHSVICSEHFITGNTFGVFFLSIFTFLQTFMSRTPLVSKLALRDQFFVTLVKLKLDMPFEYIADQCGIPSSTLHDMFWRWIDLMSAKLDFLIHWPDRETMKCTLPSVFKVKYPRLTCIIDCFEIFIDRPKKLNARAKCYSNYKKHSTVKVLIGCSPLGSITFLSEVWGCRVSDTEIVRSSGFISSIYHHPGDQILADRGFTLQDDFASVCSAELIIPAFTKGKSQLSAEEVETSRKMNSIRIHIERVIGLMKNRYKILQGTIPINMLKSTTDEASTKKQARKKKTNKKSDFCKTL